VLDDWSCSPDFVRLQYFVESAGHTKLGKGEGERMARGTFDVGTYFVKKFKHLLIWTFDNRIVDFLLSFL
jgi:hypothetical protein